MRSTASDSGVTSSRSTSPKSWNEPMSFSTLAQNPTDGLRDRQCVREQFDVRLDVRVDHVRDEFVAEVVSVGVDVGRPAWASVIASPSISHSSEVFSTDRPLGAGQNECGRDDGADSLRTQPNTVQRLPSGLEQRDAALAFMPVPRLDPRYRASAG
jgi:hypothetical protein